MGSAFAKTFLADSATPFTVTASAGWAHEFAGTARLVTAGFASAADLDFSMGGEPINRDSAVLSTSVSMTAGRANIFLRYDGQYGSLDESSAVTGGVVLMW